MYRKPAWRVAVIALAAGVVTALTLPATAAVVALPDDPDAVVALPGGPDADVGSGAAASPEMLAAMQRDLKLTASQAVTRLAKEDAAGAAAERLRTDLGAGFGGAWLAPDDQRLVVAITDPGMAARVRALGAEPRLVARSQQLLESVKTRLDRTAAPRSVFSWYVDVATNSVVVLAEPSALQAARRFVTASGADPTTVRIEGSSDRPVPDLDVRGGDGYTGCSIGFSVFGGFITAGHCGGVGPVVMTDRDEAPDRALGVVRGAVFPAADMGWVETYFGWNPRPWVNNYDGINLRVAGSREALVNSSVCRSGKTTEFRCGTIQARNVTVDYPQGRVTGLGKSNACSEPGDSGGSYLTGTMAQGVHSGGTSASCPNSDTSYFQPVRPILTGFGRTLVVAPGTITNMGCEYLGNGKFSCYVSYNPGSVQIRWKVAGVARPEWNNKTNVLGFCSIGSHPGVQVSLIHADGTDTASREFFCTGSPL